MNNTVNPEGYVVAVLGATGLVGQTMIAVLEERNFPVRTLIPLAATSGGRTVRFRGADIAVQQVQPDSFTGVDPLLDRKFEEISPIEHGVMWIGVYEMKHCADVPWRVVLNECVELAKEFGGTDGHKYVNAVLNGLAPELRALEVQADRAARHSA